MCFSIIDDYTVMQHKAAMNLNLTYTKKTDDMELISSYGTPLAQRACYFFYLALHSSLSGPVVQLIMILIALILS